MKNDILDYFLIDNTSGKKSKSKWLEKNNNELYLNILNWCSQYEELKYVDLKIQIYHYIIESSIIPNCPTCQNKLKFLSIREGYLKYCSSNCVKNSDDYKIKWKETWKNNNINGDFINKRIKTCVEKYGSMEKFYKEKDKIIKEKSNSKYGVDYYLQTDEFKKSRKIKIKNKYGDENWNNKEKTRNTRIKNGTQINESQISSFLNYKKIVTNRTTTIYRNNLKFINPNNLKRGKKFYHIDHKYSIKSGFINNIPIEIISHPCNLFMIWYKDNLIKQDKCDISLNELLENIKNYDNEIIIKHSSLNKLYQKENLLITIKNLKI